MGGALGDALGMPTQTLSPREIAETYGQIRGFVAPAEDHPVSRGLPAARHSTGTVSKDDHPARYGLSYPDTVLVGCSGDHSAG